MTAIDVLSRYSEEDLPEFTGISNLSVDTVGNFGDTPLHVACCRGFSEEVVALLNGGADINAIGEMGRTPIGNAAAAKHWNIVSILITEGAKLDIKDEFGSTAMDAIIADAPTSIKNIVVHKCDEAQ